MIEGKKYELKEKIWLEYTEDNEGSIFFEIFDDDQLLWSHWSSDLPSLKNYWLNKFVGEEDVIILQDHDDCYYCFDRKIKICAHHVSEIIIRISLKNRTVKKYVVPDRKLNECSDFVCGFGVARDQLYFLVTAPSFIQVQPSGNEDQFHYRYFGVLSENKDENNFLANTICFIREAVFLSGNELKIPAECDNFHFNDLTDEEEEELFLFACYNEGTTDKRALLYGLPFEKFLEELDEDVFQKDLIEYKYGDVTKQAICVDLLCHPSIKGEDGELLNLIEARREEVEFYRDYYKEIANGD